MQTRKHKRITSGVEGSECIICHDETAYSQNMYGLKLGDVHDAELLERHTVIKDEPHMWQNSDGSSPSPDRCEHCGHGRKYPMHRDFAGYDEMLNAFRAQQAETERKYEEEAKNSLRYIRDYPAQEDVEKADMSRKLALSGFWIFGLVGLGIGGIGGSVLTSLVMQ